ncbi:MAG: hypothetical protein A3J37_03255 [Alphaproteobacteria bacterium RIFCSPHIGHO2_12_FULL_45_9]|nr:MAG: hypothetical protein A3J37_03255 [Alphaproteobacteria bacterium RIFCSPHIGHO2_12_FULL_45_9]
MNTKERLIIVAILVTILLLVTMDLFTDSREGVVWWHLCIEGFAAFSAMIGIVTLLRGMFHVSRSLKEERGRNEILLAESIKWKEQSKKYLEGLSQSIDAQLTRWGLTPSEKEVAFLLLKGFSSKEIAIFRNTGEKTVRAQSVSIYQKSGLAGRSELSAFFLEDLMSPSEIE